MRICIAFIVRVPFIKTSKGKRIKDLCISIFLIIVSVFVCIMTRGFVAIYV